LTEQPPIFGLRRAVGVSGESFQTSPVSDNNAAALRGYEMVSPSTCSAVVTLGRLTASIQELVRQAAFFAGTSSKTRFSIQWPWPATCKNIE
jgi:hypothetical protein